MSRADDFLLTAEERRLRRRKRQRIFVFGSSFLLLLVLVFLCARPARHAIKAWQARRHAHKSSVLLAQENWSEARKEAVAAYQLWPNEPEALRAVARFLSRTRQSQALDFWEQLAKIQPLTRDDLREQATTALATGEIGRAAEAIKQLTANDNQQATPADWLLAAQLGLQKSVPNEAGNALQRVFTDPATTPREHLQAALLELRVFAFGAPEDRQRQADAWQRIEKLAAAKDDAALDSLVMLAQRNLSSNPSTDNQKQLTIELAQALVTHPLAKAPHKLLAVDLRMRAQPAEKEALLTRAVADWRDADTTSLATLATWLNGHGEYQRELDTIPLARALQSRDLFLQHVDALGALGRWEDIRQRLQSEQFPLEAMVQRMYLARCYAQLDQKVASENNWKRALESAGNDAGKLITLAEYAEKNGALEIADSAFSRAIEAAPNVRAPWQGRLRVAQASRDTKKIHGVLVEMLQRWPNDTAIQNDEAYLRLLLSKQKAESRNLKAEIKEPRTESEIQLSAFSSQLSQIERLAEELVRREPGSLPHRTLLALARLRENRPYTALEIYEGIEVPANAASPSAIAVHAAVLAATGNTEGAQNEASQIKRNELLPEERALIEDL